MFTQNRLLFRCNHNLIDDFTIEVFVNVCTFKISYWFLNEHFEYDE